MFEKKKRGYGLSLLKKDKKKRRKRKSTDFKIYKI